MQRKVEFFRYLKTYLDRQRFGELTMTIAIGQEEGRGLFDVVND